MGIVSVQCGECECVVWECECAVWECECVVWEGMREQLGVDWSVSVQCGV